MTTQFLKKLAELDGGKGEHDALYTAGLLYENRAAIRRLVEAAQSLSNEVSGMFGLAEHEIQLAIGNTNVQCVRNRLNETKAALAAFKGE